MSNIENQKTINLAIKGFSWNVIGNLVRSIAGFAVNIVLARLLGPEPFGLVALALLIVSIGNLLIESGLSSALVQQKEIDKKDIAFVFTLQMTFSVVLALVITLIAPWVSIIFGNINATLIIQVMTIILVFQAFAQVPSASLRREMKFKQIQTAQIVSFFVGYIFVGLPLALFGYGVWSLVIAQIIQFGLNAIMVFLAARHSLAITFAGSRNLKVFGIRTLFSNIAHWIIQNVDTLIVGHKFGTTNLGLYNRAYLLNLTPIGVFLSSAQTTLFSTVSRLGKSSDTLHIFRNFMSIFSICFFSLYGLIALESNNLIQIIYGQEWLFTAKLLTPLAIAMPFLMLVGLEGPVLNGLGKPQLEMRAQWTTAVFAVAVLLIASSISLEATAWSIVIIYLFRFLIMSFFTIQTLETSWSILTRPFFTGLLLEMAIICVWIAVNALLPKTLSPFLSTSIRSLSAIAVWSLIFWLGRSWILPDYSTLRDFIKQNFNA